MTMEFIILLLIVISGFAGVFWFLSRRKVTGEKENQNAFLMIQNQMNEITRTLDSKLSESSKLLHSQFGTSTKIVQDVTERLTKLDETNRQVVNFANQLQNLQDILQNPKKRAN